MKIVDQYETDILGEIIFRCVFDPGGREGLSCFRSFITVYESKYLLWVRSGIGMYGFSCELDGVEIAPIDARKITERMFPLSKWELERAEQIILDGPYLEIGMSDLNCEIYLQSGSFSHDAAWDMVNTIAAMKA